MPTTRRQLLQGLGSSHRVTRPLLSHYGALPSEERVVVDGQVVTGAGVSAGLDFALRLVEWRRGPAVAQSLMLQAEYAPPSR